jgi:hypothetical protein
MAIVPLSECRTPTGIVFCELLALLPVALWLVPPQPTAKTALAAAMTATHCPPALRCRRMGRRIETPGVVSRSPIERVRPLSTYVAGRAADYGPAGRRITLSVRPVGGPF